MIYERDVASSQTRDFIFFKEIGLRLIIGIPGQGEGRGSKSFESSNGKKSRCFLLFFVAGAKRRRRVSVSKASSSPETIYGTRARRLKDATGAACRLCVHHPVGVIVTGRVEYGVDTQL